jgi:quercetin dioxygenase-like cupin family protein
MAQREAEREFGLRVLRPADVLWRLEGAQQQMLVGILAATEHLTVGQVQLLPGRHSDAHCHAGDESLYLLEGTLNVRVPDNGGQRWFEIKPGDGFYVPEGVPHQYYNITDRPATFLFAVAPGYSPP